jgi:hypothetical protein
VGPDEGREARPTARGQGGGLAKGRAALGVPATKKGVDWRIDNILIDPKCRD